MLDKLKHGCLLIILISIIPITAIGQKNKNTYNLTLDDAIIVAKKHYNKISEKEGYGNIKKMNVEADKKNSVWNEYINIMPRILKGPNIKKMSLTNRDYWAIYFSPKKDSVFGGDAFIFIDRNTGQVIGELLGK